ncbi:MAG: type IV toxin-antitoxin system AbiEi family antitoxin [Candidatus Eremiobacteraeota bacterium]|nr:type IV toxin-antitoxin system AbiEi family antitoxin [Candidatus Eremiobacteraeota bacterium]
MKDIEKRAAEALRETLSRIPFLKILEITETARIPGSRIKENKEADAALIARVRVPSSGDQLLVIEVENSGQPRFVNRAINHFLRHKDRFRNAYCIIMAPYISPRSAEICRSEGRGYIDFSGNCSLSFKNVFIEKSNYPSLFQEKRELGSLFSPRATRILRVLLDNPGKIWKVQELSRKAKVSLGLASNIKKKLMEQEFVTDTKDGITVKEPEQLLSKWAENYLYEANMIRSYYSMKSIAVLESEIAGFCKKKGISYGLAGFSGAARLAPAVRYQQAMIFIESDAIGLIESSMKIKPADRGANISLWSPYDEYVFYGSREVNGIGIVSPVQLYLDLNRYPGRGKEAAEALLEEVIRPAWKI